MKVQIPIRKNILAAQNAVPKLLRRYGSLPSRFRGGPRTKELAIVTGKFVASVGLSSLVWFGMLSGSDAGPKIFTQATEKKVGQAEAVPPPPPPAPPIEEDPLRRQARAVAERYNIPPKLFFALIRQESAWNYKAVSHAGAIGLTQVMPFNVTDMGYDLEAFKNSPAAQLEAGAKYLSWQYEKFGRWDLALAAYNAGPGAVRKYGGIPPYRETQNYVTRILKMSDTHAGDTAGQS